MINLTSKLIRIHNKINHSAKSYVIIKVISQVN